MFAINVLKSHSQNPGSFYKWASLLLALAFQRQRKEDDTASPPLENPQKGVAMLRMYSNVETHVMEVRAHASSDQSRWVLIAGCQLGN